MRRDIKIKGILQQKVEVKSTRAFVSKKSVSFLPEKIYVLCVHDGTIPFLEAYGCDKDVLQHIPQKVLDLFNCSFVSHTVEDDRTFVVGFDDPNRPALEMTALSPSDCSEWVNVLTRELPKLECLPEQDNIYVQSPCSSKNQAPCVNNAPISHHEANSRGQIDLNIPSSHYDALIANNSTSDNNLSQLPIVESLYESLTGYADARVRNTETLQTRMESAITTTDSEAAPDTQVRCIISQKNGQDFTVENGQNCFAPQLPPRISKKDKFFVVCAETSSNYDDVTRSTPSFHSPIVLPRSNESSADDANLSVSNHAAVVDEEIQGKDEIVYGNVLEFSGICRESSAESNSISPTISGYSKIGLTRSVGDCDLLRLTEKVAKNRLAAAATIAPHSPNELSGSTIRSRVETDSPSELAARFESEGSEREEVPLAPSTAPPPPPLPLRNLNKNDSVSSGTLRTTYGKKLSVKENAILKLRREIESGTMIKVNVDAQAAILGLALVEVQNQIWVAGWSLNYSKSLAVGFHVGDRVLEIGGKQVAPKLCETQWMLDSLAFTGSIEITLQRLPHAKAYVLKRNFEGEDLGIVRKKAENEIIEIEADSIAALAGLKSKMPSYSNPGSDVNCFLTEINGRPLSLFARNNEAGERLSAVGLDLTIVVQPVDFIKALKKCLQRKKNYKGFVIGF